MDELFDEIDANLNHYGNEDIRQVFSRGMFNNFVNLNLSSDKDSLSLIHINIRSLSKNYETFKIALETIDLKFDLICVSETWMHEHVLDIYFPNYVPYHKMRSDRRGGGVAIYVKNVFLSKELAHIGLCNENTECIFTEITHRNKKIVIGTTYRPPSGNKDQFEEDITSRLSMISNIGDTILAGDVNMDLLRINENNNVAKFYESIVSCGLIPSISQPTHIFTCRDSGLPSATLIDNIFASNPNYLKAGIINLDVSDHLPIIVVYDKYFTGENKAEKVKYRIINEFTIAKFIDEFSKINLYNSISPYHDCNTSIKILDEIIFSVFDKCCPLKSKISSPKDQRSPWLSREVKQLLKLRHDFFNLMRRGAIETSDYNAFRNSVTSVIRTAKAEYHKSLFRNIRDNAKKTWRAINNVLKPARSINIKIIKSVIYNDMEWEDDSAICNAFNDHFVSVGGKINDCYGNDRIQCTVQEATPNSIFLSWVTESEVSRIILALKDKNCNISAYPNKILKSIHRLVAPIIAHIINVSFMSGVFPQCMKSARVVPIFKSGDERDVGNYRPISVLPVLSKIFERTMYNRVISFMEKYNILSKSQYGFRRGLSTSQAIMDNLSFIYRNLDQGKPVLSLFLDFKKAFDCVEHKILLLKLYMYGIRGAAYRWFESYLSNRDQYTSVNGVNSSKSHITHGVPQGSILGPVLFLIFINDLPNVNSFFKFTLFADDSTVSCAFEDHDNEFIARTIEQQLIPINKWLVINRLTVNHSKTVFIAFSHRKEFNIRPIKFGNHYINQTSSTKFLGLTIDSHLKFDSHINNICNKTSKTVGILFKLNKFMPLEILKSIYQSLITPYLTYCQEIYYSAPQIYTNRIKIIQKKAVRAMNSLPYNAHTDEYFKSMQLLKLDDMFTLATLTNVYEKVHNHNFIPPDTRNHPHFTRNRNQLAIPLLNRNATQKTFVYQEVIKWNALPLELKDTDKKPRFKKRVKDFLLSSY